MGFTCSYDTLDITIVGTQLHAIHQLLPRLCSYVCQVPYCGINTRYSRVHHTFVGDDGIKEDYRRA